jgi:CheY-like chemotaxis protein
MPSLLTRCGQVFGAEWTATEAAEIHQRIEVMAEEVDSAGLAELSESLLELSVFLCSLVDMGAAPSAASQARIAAMCAAMLPQEVAAAAPVQERAALAERAPLVLLLVPPGVSAAALVTEIGRRKLLASQVDSLEGLAAEVSKRPVSVVAIDISWVDRAAEVSAAIERAHPHALTQPGLLAVIEAGNRSRRMFALRAGVDQVVEESSASTLADEISAFVHKRRHSAFRVLVVEDDHAQALFAQRVLGHRGIETRVAASAEAALAMVEDFRPDLCLLDLNLPDRNGIELAQMLRERPGFELVQIVFLTGEMDPDARALAVRLGADDWIVKPVRPRDLLTVVESRAERARRAAPHDPVAGLGRDAARGVHSRRRVVSAIASAIAEPPSDDRSVLIAVSPQLPPEDLPGVSWEAQAELGGEIARALRGDGLVRSEVCQAETLCCLFIADPSAAGQVALAALANSLDRRQWLGAAESGVRLAFAVAGLPLDPQLTPHGAIESVLSLLRKAREQAPRVRFQAGASAQAAPPGWPQLRKMFNDDALGRSHRLAFHPLVPVTGTRSGQFLLSAEFEVVLDDGGSVVPDHRAFARSAGFHLKLDQWLLSRCLDRLRLSRGGLSLHVEVCPESLEDPALAAWLQAELQRRRIPAPDLMLWVAADRMRGAGSRVSQYLRPYAAMGVQIGIGPLGDTPAELELLKLDEVHMISCRAGATATEISPVLLQAAAERGKSVLVDSVDDPSTAGAVFRLPIHYVTGLAISPPLTRPEFEFPSQ